jgi:predicted HNH restriction endonuclease
MNFGPLAAVIDGFNDIDPKRIEPTIQPVFKARGLPKENKTENYLYGFARAYLEAVGKSSIELAEELIEPALYSEGAKKTIIVNAFERSTAAKAKCIRQHGRTCVVCKVDMGDIYGDIGRGFVHVHHLNPVAGRGGAYKLDAVKDLRPVCPNCHSMLHRENPPLTIEQLQDLIRRVRRKR